MDPDLADSHSFGDSHETMETTVVMPMDMLRIRHREPDGTVYFESYIPPSRDAIHMPDYMLYLLIASCVVVGVLYAIIGHLIKDLIHDCADGMFGEQPEEVVVNYCEAKDKFMVDWCPETTPELEEMARDERNKARQDKDFVKSPALWTITTERRGSRPPRVVFTKV